MGLVYGLILLFAMSGCTSFELTSENGPSGEWQRPLDLNLKESQSLQDLSIKLDCRSWELKTNSNYSPSTTICKTIKKKLEFYGAHVLKMNSDEKYNYIISYRRILQKSEGCGLGGWISYLSFWIIPCKGREWENGELVIRDKNGTITNNYPMSFNRRTYFGWLVLLNQSDARNSEIHQDKLISDYISNRIYTTNQMITGAL